MKSFEELNTPFRISPAVSVTPPFWVCEKEPRFKLPPVTVIEPDESPKAFVWLRFRFPEIKVVPPLKVLVAIKYKVCKELFTMREPKPLIIPDKV